VARRARIIVAAGVILLAAAGGGFLVVRDLSTAAYANPVLKHDAPDPSVIRADDGFFYAYTTQSDWPTLKNIPILRSSDLIEWRFAGDAFPRRPRWVTTDMWAPHIARIGGDYLLYYCARRFGSAGFAIGVARSDSPTGPFRDRGKPILHGRGFKTLDPFVYTTPAGRNYIYWGSDEAPISVQRLTDDGLDVVGRAKALIYPSDRAYEGLLEGAWLVRHGDFYYLMYSGDACCEPEPHYAVLVARSRSPLGPFVRYEGNPILAANADFYGPGHNATIRDAKGRDWMLYHAFVRGDVTATRQLMLDPIQWEDGWPVVNGGAGPSSTSDDAPALERS
jgi:arabinan endo-1,5-alpha-L-arabinosidase